VRGDGVGLLAGQAAELPVQRQGVGTKREGMLG